MSGRFTRLHRSFLVCVVLVVCRGLCAAGPGDIAIYREATAGDAITTATFDHDWDTVVREVSDTYALGGTDISLKEGGHYLVLYSMRIDRTGSGNERTETQSNLRLNGADLPIGWSQGYTRWDSGQREKLTSGGAIIQAATNDVVTLHTFRTDAQTPATQQRLANTAGIQFMKLNDNWDYCRVSRTTSQTGPTANGSYIDVVYDDEQEVDTGTFAHTASTAGVTLNSAGHYLVFANTFLNTGTTSTRTLFNHRLLLGGTAVPGSRTTVYVRGNPNSDSCQDGAAAIGMIIQSTAPGQVLKVQVLRSGGAASTIVADRTALTVVKLPDTAEYIRLNDASGFDLNQATSPTPMPWGTEVEEDATCFAHDTAVNSSRVGVTLPSDYLFLSAVFSLDGAGNGDGWNRQFYWQRWRINGSDLVPYGGSGRICRSNSADGNDGGNWSGLITALSDGDYVESVSQRMADDQDSIPVDDGGLQGVRIATLLDKPDIGGPTAVTPSPTNAWLGATLTWTGSAPTEVWAYWGTTDEGTNLSWASSHYFGTNAMATPVAISNNATGLTPSTAHYYRFRAVNAHGVSWSAAGTSFLTPGPPTVNNDAGATPGQGHAVLNAELSVGETADATIYWGTTDEKMNAGAWENTNTLATLLSNGPFSCDTRGMTEAWTNGGLQSLTIGPRGLLGNTVEANGTYTLTGSGQDIYNNADNFQFAYKRVAGDFDVYCRIGTFTGGDNDWRKAGIMARESLTSGSKNISFVRAPTNGQHRFAITQRTVDYGASTSVPHSPITATTNAAYWARLVRVGDTFTTYWATNTPTDTPGTWTQQYAPVDMPMTRVVYLGLAVTAHDVTQTTTVPFDNLTGQVATGDLLYGQTYYYRSYATNSHGDDWADTTATFVVGRPEPEEQPQPYAAGLGFSQETRVGNWASVGYTWPNPQMGSDLGPGMAKTNAWPTETLYVYNGEIYFNGTDPYCFVENIDDDAWLSVDRTEYLTEASLSGDVTTSGLINRPAGWYPIEFRLYNDGGAGGRGVRLDPGIQYNDNGLDSTSDGDNWYPEDDGKMTLFRHRPTVRVRSGDIENLAASAVTAISATFNGTLAASAATYDVRVHWGQTDEGTTGTWDNVVSLGTFSDVTSVALAYGASGLTENTQYYYAFSASNVVDMFWAQPSMGVMTATDPSVSNAPATDLAASSATLNATVLAGGSTDVDFYWGTVDAGMMTVGWQNTNSAGTVGDGDVDVGISGLVANQTYFYRARGANSQNNDWGDPAASFTTPVPTLSIADASVTETDAGTVDAVFFVTLSAPCATAISVDYATADGSAVTGGDYVGTTGTLTIPAGLTATQIVVAVKADDLDEKPSEFFTVELSNPTDCAIPDPSAAGTIMDDDLDMSEWAYKVKITFNGYTGTTTLTNFPALVILNDGISNFTYDAFASATGGDLRFTDAADTKLLNYEVETWNDGSGDSYVWVQVPELADNNTFIWAYAGNVYDTTPPPYTTDGSTWSEGFQGVWHMNQQDPLDSTAFGRDGTSNDGPAIEPGAISLCQKHDGNDWSDISDYYGVHGNQDRTCSAWIRKTNAVADVDIMSWGSNNGGRKWVFRTQDDNGQLGGLRVEVNGSYIVGITNLMDSQWHHVAAVLDDQDGGDTYITDITLYVDGVAQTGGTVGSGTRTVITTAERPLILGGEQWTPSRAWDSFLDETRVATTARSADWMLAEYLNGASNGVFLNYGEANYNNPAAPLVADAVVSNVLNTTADLNATATWVGAGGTAAWVFWGTEDGQQEPAYWDSSQYVGAVAAPMPLPTSVGGLSQNTLYHFAYRLTNAAGLAWAPGGTFLTYGSPVVSTAPATGIAQTAATLNGELMTGGEGDISIYWGLSDEGPAAGTWDHTNSLSVASNGAFSAAVTPRAGGTYYYRCYVTNAYGDDWADVAETFTTPQAGLGVADVSVTEGDAGTVDAVFAVTLTHPPALTVTVDVDSSNLTAEAGSDYAAVSTTLTVPAGVTATQIVVSVNGDTENEWPWQEFALNLNNSTNAVITDGTGVGRINDDDLSSGAWGNRLKIAFGGYTGTETLTNFPALIVLNEALDGFSYAQVSSPIGADLRFMDAARREMLDFEIEQWNPAGDSFVWVRVPKVVPTDAAVWAFWNNPAMAGAALPPSQTDGSVWDATHLAVYHLQETNTIMVGTNAVVVTPDQTVNGLHARRYASVTNPAAPGAIGGLIGGAQHFAGIQGANENPSNNQQSYQYAFPATTNLTGYSVLLWCKPDSVPQELYTGTFNNNGGDDFQISADGAGNWISAGDANPSTPNFGAQTTNWTHMAVASDPGAPMLWAYRDGEQVAAIAGSDNDWGRIEIGCNRNRDQAFTGIIDEVRVLERPVSADWMKATYLNTASNAAFMTPSTEGTLLIISDSGTGNPAPGLHSNAYDSVQVIGQDAVVSQSGIQYINRGWAMTGNAPMSGTTNQFSMTVTNDAVLTWLWDTNFWLDTEAAAYGSVAPGDQWVPAGSNVTVVATADSNYTFGVWMGDGTNYITAGNIYSPTVTVTVTAPVQLTAVFDRQPVIDNGPVAAEYGVADLGYNLTDGGAANVTIYWGPADGGTNASNWAYSIGPNGVPEGAGAFQTMDPAPFGVRYHYRAYAMNTDGEAWAPATAMFTARDPNYDPGLRYGAIPANPMDTITPNPGSSSDLGPGIVKSNGAPDPWAYNTTFIYDGQIYFDGGDYVFIERIDDNTWMKVDGEWLMQNNSWSDHSYSPVISNLVGWHDFELRFHQGTGGGGWIGDTNSGLSAILNPGFQYNTNGVVSTDVDDYVYPEDDGSMSLFRYHRAPSNAWARIHNESPTPGGITPTSLTFNATLEAYETVFDVYCHYGATDAGTTGAWDSTVYVGSYTNLLTQPISHTAPGLTPDTEYFYAFSASNALVHRWGEPSLSASTVGPPTVDNAGGTIATVTTWGQPVIMNGSLTAGGAAEVTVYWGASDGGTNAAAWGHSNTVGTQGQGAFSSQTDGNLLYGLQYYYRCYASNSSGNDWADTSEPFVVPVQVARVNGLDVETYNNRAGDTNLFPFMLDPITPDGMHTLTGDLNFDAVNPTMMAVYPSIVNEDSITVMWQGVFEANEATSYGFGTQSDDGSMIFLDLNRDGDFEDPGELIIDNRGAHGDEIVTAAVDLMAGFYRIAITFYESGGGDTMRARWGKDTADWNAMDWINGAAGPFLSEADPDVTVANAAPSDMTASSATFSGLLTAPNAVYDAYVYWGTVDEGTGAGAWANTDLIGRYTNANAQALVYAASGLPADTEIFYTFGATNVQVLELAEPSESFRTVIPPVVDTTAANITGARTATLNASLDAGGSADLTVYWGATDGGPAAGGWDNTNGLGLLANGAFTVNATNLLGAETYFYQVYATNSEGSAWADAAESFTTPVGTITIADAPATVEGDSGTTPAVFDLTLSVPSGPDVTVNYVATDGTAQAGRDFAPDSGMVTFTTGQTNAQITVQVRGDTENETGAPETYTVDLSNPVNATLTDASGAGSIVDDDDGLTDCPYKMKIVFSGYTGTDTLTNFPALVTLNNSLTNFDYAGFASPTGGDLRFFNAAEDRELNYEVEDWNTNGDSQVWVQVPELVDSTTYIWATWGCPDKTEAPAYTTNGATWTEGFAAVYHANEAGGADVRLDSTANNRHGTPYNAPTGVAAVVAGGDDLDRTSTQGVGLPASFALFDGNSSFSVSTWFNMDSFGPTAAWNDSPALFSARGENSFMVTFGDGLPLDSVGIRMNAGGWNNPVRYDGVQLNRWYHIAATMDVDAGRLYTLYVDGTAASSNVRNNTINGEGGQSFYGGTLGGNNRFADGTLDEIRVETASRSADWVKAVFLNMASNAIFNGYGPVEDTIPGAPMIAIVDGPTNVLATTADVSADVSSTGAAQTVVWVHWSEHDGGLVPGYWDNSLEVATIGGSLPETVVTNLTGLLPNTMYYYAFQATNSSGSRWAGGEFVTFGPPVVENTGASSIALTSATLNGELVSTSPTDVTIYWGLTDGSVTPPWENTNTMSLAGSGPFSVAVPVLADATYYYTSYGTNAWGDDWATTVTNFTTPEAELSISDVAMTEADTDYLFTVTLSHTSATAVAVNFTTVDGTATAGSDYTQTNGTLTIPSGSVSGQILVPVNDDADVEWPSEAFTVVLSNPVNAPLTDTVATGTITDNDVGMDDWAYRMQIDFTEYAGSTTLSNFPALVILNESRPGFSYDQFASPTGADLRFTDGSGTQLLDYEIERWDTNGDSVVWVRVPEVMNNTDSIVAYWGRPGIGAPPAAIATATWDATHEAVWHMNEGASADPATDATVQMHDGAPTGTPPTSSGAIAGARSMDGLQKFTVGSTLDLSGKAFTLSSWANRTATASGDNMLFGGGTGAGNQGLHCGFRWQSPNWKIWYGLYGDDARCETDYATDAGAWHHYTWVMDGVHIKQIYRDGVAVPMAGTQNNFYLSTGLVLGGTYGGGTSYKGILDEMRASYEIRPADWILARYEMEKPNSTFLTYNAAAPQFPTLEILSAHGSPTPAAGTYTNAYGTVLTNSVNSPIIAGSIEYACTGWSMSGNVPLSGTTNTMTMTHTNDAVLTWLWETNALNDLGDLPASYGITLLADNGAAHEIPGSGGVFLGAQIDAENEGQESAAADGDDADTDGDDEDGIAVSGGWQEGPDEGAVSVDVTGGSGYLSAWIDWDANNQFTDPGDQVLDMAAVAAGSQTLTFDVPSGVFTNAGTFPRFARFRLWTGSTPALAVTGLVVNGEVEDYELAVVIDNIPPVALADATGTVSGAGAVLYLLANDTDADGDPLTITNVTQGTKGTVVIDPGATSVTYTATLGEAGYDQFTYWVSDGQGGWTTGLVTVAIDPLVVYVSPTGSNIWPYADIGTAATDIQTAVDAVAPSGMVWVTNGIYNTGGAAVDGMDCRVALTKPVTVRSLNGAAVTIIMGQGPAGPLAVRCLYMTNGAVMGGFTLSNGFTRTVGFPNPDINSARGTAPNGVTSVVEDQHSGGGVRLHNGGVLSNCVIRGNSAFARGAGVFCDGGGTVRACTIVDNQATGPGGGASLHGGELIACIVSANSAAEGGGVHVGSPGLIRNCLVVSNSAPLGGGLSLISTGLVAATVQNCTVCSNSATTGGGIYTSSLLTGPTIDNTIVYYNSATLLGPNWYDIGQAPAVYAYVCTTPTNGLVGAENIDDEPLFARNSAGGYRLRASSPCKNTGINQPWMVGDVDLVGVSRIVATAVDRGCYEYPNATDVVLYQFWLTEDDAQVVVRWQTASEIGTLGFMLYRQIDDAWVLVNTDGMIPAKGAPLGGIGASYSYVDAIADPDTSHTYKLVEIMNDGTQEYGPFQRAVLEVRFVSPMTAAPGGVAIRWLSRPGDVYRVYSSDSLRTGFMPLSGPLSATPPQNVYIDGSTGTGTRYYQIRLEK